MTLILNIIWLIVVGIPLAIEWIISGIICYILIVTIPFGGGCFRMASSVLMPFGKEVVNRKEVYGENSPIRGTLWVIFCGWWLWLSYIVAGIGFFITIIGIPLGIKSFQLAKIALNPYKYDLL